MKILLISPLDPATPVSLKFLMGGENTYTRMLLRYPPKGMTFIHFQHAIEQKLISYHWSYFFLLWLQKLRILPLGPRAVSFTIYSHFDLVYAHAYPVKIVGKSLPVIISESSSNKVTLEKYLKIPKWRIVINQKIKQLVFSKFGIIDAEVTAERSQSLFVFSRWAKKIKNLEYKIKSCNVLYPGLPIPKKIFRKKSNQIKILFVGVWFERKGGRILLEVFRTLYKKYPHISLTILGELPKDIILLPDEPITQYDFVPYESLLEFYKTHNILVHIPPEIEGYGMTVGEAMSYGMCIIVSNICALPEFVKNGKSGLVVAAGSADDLEKALIRLIKNRKLRLKLGKSARERFRRNFSLPVFQQKLLGIFQEAVE